MRSQSRILQVLVAVALSLAALATPSGADSTARQPGKDTRAQRTPVAADSDPVQIPLSTGVLTPDTDPAAGRYPNFACCAGATALDYNHRSIGLDFGQRQSLTSIDLVNRSGSSRVGREDWTLWWSNDNLAYAELTNWAFESTVVDGREVHRFTELGIRARYVKVRSEFADTAFTFVISSRADIHVQAIDVAPQADPPKIVDSWTVTGAATFPGEDVQPAYRPAVTAAPNGDLLMAFNTSTDANPGGELRLIRSTDNGRSWGPSTTIARPSNRYPGGAVASSRGMLTLSDGTILLPYGEAVNHTEYLNREGVIFVARSTDNGHTWTGTDEPITTPIPIREAFNPTARLVELADGSVLMPTWGTHELAENWEQDPNPWTIGLLRSPDGGRTWTEFNEVAADVNHPAMFPPFWGSKIMGGPNEFDVKELPDGRLLALIRYDTNQVSTASWQLYRSISSDDGRTWSTPQGTGYSTAAFSYDYAPCSAVLENGATKMVVAGRGYQPLGTIPISYSFDNGVTWEGTTRLQDPDGATNLGTLNGEPEFWRIDDTHLLVFFQISTAGEPFRIVANLIEDKATVQECRNEYDAAIQRSRNTPTVVVERADRESWIWPHATRSARHDKATTIAELTTAAAAELRCTGTELQLREQDRLLDPTATLEQVGIGNGDVVTLGSASDPSRSFAVGRARYDLFPEVRRLYGWDRACPGPVTQSENAASIGLDLSMPKGQRLKSVELRHVNDSRYVMTSNYRLFASHDNSTFVELSGWTLTDRVEDGRRILRFDGIASKYRYLKIHQPFATSMYALTVPNSWEDISIEYGNGAGR